MAGAGQDARTNAKTVPHPTNFSDDAKDDPLVGGLGGRGSAFWII
jgi:hypothetical protein